MFQRALKQIDAANILQAIEVPQQFEEPQPQGSERFNESVLRVLCLNQAIDKMQKETALLFSIKDQILSNLQTKERMSSKLENFIFQMRMHGEQQQPDPHQHPMSEFDNSKCSL